VQPDIHRGGDVVDDAADVDGDLRVDRAVDELKAIIQRFVCRSWLG
jgi:hypothetical protein